MSEHTDEGIAHVEYEDWREHLESGTLLGVQCQSCDAVSATPKRACPGCGSREMTAIELPERGTVYSETKINVPPEGFDGTYQVGVVGLGEARLLARIRGSVDIGETVVFAGTIVEGDGPGPVFESAE